MITIEERRRKNLENRGRTSSAIQVERQLNRKAGCRKVKGTTTCKGWSTNESSFANASIFDKSLNIGSNQEVFRNEFIAHNFFFKPLSFTGISKMLSGLNILQNGWLNPIFFIGCYNVIHLVEIHFDFLFTEVHLENGQKKTLQKKALYSLS